jgi:3',5'-cyclic AMP phosphodiesterase CpdA
MFVLAHLSDPPLGPLPQPRISELASKRLLGFVNWHLRRGRQHLSDVLAAWVADMKAAAPDHIAVTGDLVNIALPVEYEAARLWLESVGPPDRVSLVPGNHDIYVHATSGHARSLWDEYMRGDAGPAPTAPLHFPFVRRRGPVALIGVSTALPTFPLLATGKVGAQQIEGLAQCLAQLKHEALYRVVLIHHPPAGKENWRKRLADSGAVRCVLAEHGADLVIHGHHHLHSVEWIDGPSGRIPVVGVPSASIAQGSDDDPAAYHLFLVEGTPGAWRCELVMRGLAAGRAGIVELKRLTLGS